MSMYSEHQRIKLFYIKKGDVKFNVKVDMSRFKKGNEIIISSDYCGDPKDYGDNVEFWSNPKSYTLKNPLKDAVINNKNIYRVTKKITGKTTAKAYVRMNIKGKKYKTVRADSKGNFIFKVNLKKYTKHTEMGFYSYARINGENLTGRTKKFKLK